MTVSGLKKPWEEVREASKLTWFRQYDCRHTAITRLAEGGTPMATIMKRAGHVSPKMTDHYTHISDQSEIQSVRTAQHYNGCLGPNRGTTWSTPAAPQPVDMVGQLLKTMQEQFGLTPEQVRDALLAQMQTASSPNVIAFPPRV
jgi:hypothetical protein